MSGYMRSRKTEKIDETLIFLDFQTVLDFFSSSVTQIKSSVTIKNIHDKLLLENEMSMLVKHKHEADYTLEEAHEAFVTYVYTLILKDFKENLKKN